MQLHNARHTLAIIIALTALTTATATFAQDAKPVSPAPAGVDKVIDLTPAEIAERDGRKACKIAICSAFHARKAGADISCPVVKSWRREQLNAMAGKAKVSWPFGAVRCTTEVKLKRDFLVKALVEPKYEATIETHRIVCEVDRDPEPKASIAFEITPKVTFEKGRAVKALMGWGKIEAPALVKGAMWTATATDNTFNVLQNTVVEDINDFTSAKCDEVKQEWDGK
jgi:hypothetical protein